MNANIEELAALFECDPDYQGLESEKPYAFATLEKIIGDVKVILRIMPPIGEFEFKAFRNGELFFDFVSRTSSSVKAEVFEDKHLLVIEDGNKSHTFIRIKPDFFVGHEIKGY